MPVGDAEFDQIHPKARRLAYVRFSAIGEAWGLYRERWMVWSLTVLVVIVGYAVINGGLAAILDIARPGNPGGFRNVLRPRGSALEIALGLIVTGFFVGGMMRMACRQVRGLPFEVDTLFSVTNVLVNLALGALLTGVACGLGFLLLVIPGLVIFGLLMFTIPLIVDAGLPPERAIGQSWNALKGEWLTATVFHLLVWLLATSGSIFCCVGLLATAPLYSLSIAVLYRDFFLKQAVDPIGKPPRWDHEF